MGDNKIFSDSYKELCKTIEGKNKDFFDEYESYKKSCKTDKQRDKLYTVFVKKLTEIEECKFYENSIKIIYNKMIDSNIFLSLTEIIKLTLTMNEFNTKLTKILTDIDNFPIVLQSILS